MARPLAAILVLTALALAGCTASDDGGAGPGDGPGGGNGTGTTTVGSGGIGSASAYLKDAPADDFAEVHVMVTAACVHRSGGTDGATTTAGNGTTTGNGTAGNGTGGPTTSGTSTSSATTTSASGTRTGDGSSNGTDPCMGPSAQGQGQGQGRQGGSGPTGTVGTCAARTGTTATMTTTGATTAGNGTGNTTGNGTTATGSGTATWSTSASPGTTTSGAGSGSSGWVVLFSDPAGLDVDLLNTTGARAAFLGEASLAAGSYQQVRIEVCAAWGITHDGQNVTIEVASGTLRSVRSFTVPAGQESRITVDLDLDRSLREQGNGQWRLTPVVGKTTVATVADASSGEDTAQPGEVVPIPEADDGVATTTTTTGAGTGAGTGGNATTATTSSTSTAGPGTT